MVIVAGVLWRVTPGSLVPDEDQGFYIAAVILPDGASLQRTDQVVSEVVKRIRTNEYNQDVVAFTGFDFLGGGFRNNAATIFVTQIPWDKRKGVTTPQLVGDFFMKTGDIKEGLALAFAPPAIFGSALPAAPSSISVIAVMVARRHWRRQWVPCSAACTRTRCSCR